MTDTQLSTRSTGLAKLTATLNNETIQQKFRSILEENAGAFMASIIELYQSDSALQRCDPNKIMLEALKAATLKLPINRQLGFAYIIPYGNVPTFQMGYKGYIQLAQRSGQYKHINADIIYEGEKVAYNRVTGMLEISGEATSDKPIGYFAYFQLINGFEKCVYWTREKVEAHAQRYSKAWSKQDSPWHTNFDAMALKSVIRNIISKYGVMSVEFANALSSDNDEATIEAGIAARANGRPIAIPAEAAQEISQEVTRATLSDERHSEAPDELEPGF